MKKTREMTASSPSGVHMGHYKIGAENNEIAEILASMASMPFMNGFAPSRWENSIHVMLEKIAGCPIVVSYLKLGGVVSLLLS